MRATLSVLIAAVVGLTSLQLTAQGQPSPSPFPRAGGNPAPPPAAPVQRTPSAPAPLPPPAPAAGRPTDTSLGLPGIIYPTADFLESYDLGRDQRCYLFGTNLSFLETVAYYKQVLKDGGRELFKAPAMQQFDLAKFQDQTMSMQPSVVVKDYSFGGDGYLHVEGTQSKRFKTIIQIVPVPGR